MGRHQQHRRASPARAKEDDARRLMDGVDLRIIPSNVSPQPDLDAPLAALGGLRHFHVVGVREALGAEEGKVYLPPAHLRGERLAAECVLGQAQVVDRRGSGPPRAERQGVGRHNEELVRPV